MKLHIPALAIAFLAPFIAQKDIRYYLNGLNVRPLSAEEGGGVLLAATNGHIAGLWHADDATCERQATLHITPETVEACCQNSNVRHVTIINNRLAVIEQVGNKPPVEIYIQPSNTWADAQNTDLNHWGVAGAADHPANKRLLEAFHSECDRGPTCQIDSTHIKAITKAFRAGSDVGMPPIYMRQQNHTGSVVVLSEYMPHAAAVVMPWRDNGLKRPTWIDRLKSACSRAATAKSAPLPVHEPSDAGPPESDIRGWALAEGLAA